MNNYQETFNTWNKIASLYEDRFMDLTIYNESYDFFCDAVSKENPNILEIGCGPGNITKYILEKRTDFKLDGIDVAPNMIELAKKNNPSAQFKVLDCREINSLTQKYDGIICGFCLPYLSHADGEKFIADCSQLLNSTGVLYISFVEGEKSKSGFQVGSSGDRSYFYFYPLEELKQILSRNGFHQIKLFKIDFERANGTSECHTVLIVQKI